MYTETLFEQAKRKLGYNANGLLRSTSEVFPLSEFENLSSISEWLALEKAKRLEADYVYFRRFSDRPSQALVYVYDFTHKTGMPDDSKLGIVQKNIWSSSEVPVAFIFSKEAVRIINTTCQPIQDGHDFSPVDLIGLASEITEEIQERFSSYRLDSGEFWHEEEANFTYDRSAHKTLLAKLKSVRENFLLANVLQPKLVNRLLIQCVLIRFLEEKKEHDEHGKLQQVFPPDFFQKIAKANSFKESLKKGTFIRVFNYLNKKDRLNGQIFEWKGKEKKELENIPTNELINLLYETDKDEKSQLAFWDLYSFRFLPVEVVSSIYEALFTSEKSVKQEGMVYTPPHLAAYLVDESMPLNEWKNKTNFKILDPSCGSGIFLVLAFKRLVHWWRLNNKGATPNVNDLTLILSKSIIGIDSNENAVLLTRFSLCLSICGLLSPPEIYSELHFPKLKNELVYSDFFTWYGKNKKNANFDLVIGNPPFVQAHKNLPDWQGISDVKIPQKQIALYFLSAATKLVKEKGLICLLLKSSSFLYTSTGNNYRKKKFQKNRVHQILDFTLLARNRVLWEKEEPDTLAIFTSKEQPDTSKNILHLVVKRTPSNSLKKHFEIDTYDFHWVSYVSALQDNFVWKCNLLGGGRLYGLIKSLKLFPTLKNNFKENKWTYGEGYEVISSQAKFKADYITDKPYLPYSSLTTEGIIKGEYPVEKATKFYRPAKKELYTPPHILIREVINENGKFAMGFSDEYLTFKVQIIGIAAPKPERDLLYNLFLKLKEKSKFYFAIIFATSPRCLVVKNTSFSPSDLYSLPYNHSSEIKLTHNEDVIINDVMKYYQDFIRHINSKVLHPILSKDIEKRLINFASIFCETINPIYQNKNLRFRYVDAGVFNNNNFIYIAFRYDDKPEFKFDENNKIPEISNEKLQKLLKHEKGHVRFSRILKIYKKDYVCFIKPNQLRYWLDSIALRDADWVISDLVKKGY